MFYNFATNFVRSWPSEVNITNDIEYYIRKLGNGKLEGLVGNTCNAICIFEYVWDV